MSWDKLLYGESRFMIKSILYWERRSNKEEEEIGE
jgi:hypothetical protein